MNVSLYQAAAALKAADRWQEVATQNLAAVAVPGYKKQDLSFSAVQAGMMPTATGAPQQLVMPGTTTTTNFQPGQLRPTGVATDVAIDGPGFFSASLSNGQTVYTRDGEFQLNAQGELVTKQGYPVLSDGGVIQIDPKNPAPLSIAADGTVSQGSDVKGKLALTAFNNPQLLTTTSNGYFAATNPSLQTVDASGVSVRQGWLESSNTSAVAEMAHMIAAMRHYEANQRVIQIQDERMNHAITELGNPNPS